MEDRNWRIRKVSSNVYELTKTLISGRSQLLILPLRNATD